MCVPVCVEYVCVCVLCVYVFLHVENVCAYVECVCACVVCGLCVCVWSMCMYCMCGVYLILCVCWLPLLQGMAGIDDVLACQVDAEGVVNVKDTFNFQMGRNNLIDDPHIEEHNVRTKGWCVCSHS